MAADLAKLREPASARLGERYNEAELADDPGWSDAEKLTLACRMNSRHGHQNIFSNLPRGGGTP